MVTTVIANDLFIIRWYIFVIKTLYALLQIADDRLFFNTLNIFNEEAADINNENIKNTVVQI